MGKLIFVQVKIPEEILERLKRKTEESTTKEALSEAINHYINCFMAEKEDKANNQKGGKKRSGRDPMYLEHLLNQKE
ncbi:MAG: DUF5371 family protein [Archaeoglobaceae archaeon]